MKHGAHSGEVLAVQPAVTRLEVGLLISNKVQSLYDCQMSSKAKLLWCTHRVREETALLFISKGDEQMKNYQHWSLETLKHKRDSLMESIQQWERVLVEVNSKLVQLSLTHYIKKAKEEIRTIDAELCYREHNA